MLSKIKAIVVIAILIFGINLVISQGTLKDDWTVEGWGIKILLLTISMGTIAFAISTFSKGVEGRTATLMAVSGGIRKGLNQF